jgi:hypothetical protein
MFLHISETDSGLQVHIDAVKSTIKNFWQHRSHRYNTYMLYQRPLKSEDEQTFLAS